MPRKNDLSRYARSDLDKVALRLNQRPRRTLGTFCGDSSIIEFRNSTTHAPPENEVNWPNAYKQSNRFRIDNVAAHEIVEKIDFSVYRYTLSDSRGEYLLRSALNGREVGFALHGRRSTINASDYRHVRE